MPFDLACDWQKNIRQLRGKRGAMTAMTLSSDTARTWIDRWDAQQQEYLPDREDRFTAIIDAVEENAARPDPLVLDLGSGPGSLAVRLLRRLPRATVVAIDADPLTLALGRAAYGEIAGLEFRDLDLRTAGWSAGLQLDRQPDAAVSTTALHWLTQPALAALYAELAARRVESEHHGSPAGRLSVHVDALRAAGFAEVGTLWQRGENRLLC